MMFIYVIQRGDRKIGLSSEPRVRALNLAGKLEYQLACPPEFAAHAEARAHELLAKRHYKGEWFACGKRPAIAAVKEAVAWAAAGNQHPKARQGSVVVSLVFAEKRAAQLAEAEKFWGESRKDHSVDSIAERVGIGKRTIARYIGSRESFRFGKSLRNLQTRLGKRRRERE